jgi:hypothetical protein
MSSVNPRRWNFRKAGVSFLKRRHPGILVQDLDICRIPIPCGIYARSARKGGLEIQDNLQADDGRSARYYSWILTSVTVARAAGCANYDLLLK